MPFLEIATTLCIGLLIGTEFAVAVFIDPVLWKLADEAQAEAIRLFARRLGRAMPFWYGASFLLLVAVLLARLHHPHAVLLGAASAVWAIVIVLSILLLVPINNRLAQLNAQGSSPMLRTQHRRWDALHRVRVSALVVAMASFLAGIQT